MKAVAILTLFLNEYNDGYPTRYPNIDGNLQW